MKIKGQKVGEGGIRVVNNNGDDDNFIKTGIEIPPALHRRIKARAAESGKRMKDVWVEALTQWDAGEHREGEQAEFKGLVAADRALIRRLAEWRRNGERPDLWAIIETLVKQVEKERGMGEGKPRKRAG